MVDLVTSEEKLKKLVAQPSFKQFKIFYENLVAVERVKVELTLNRLIYVGFGILDLLKMLIVSTTITSSESIQTWRCYLLIQIPSRITFKQLTYTKTFMLISSCSIFLGMGKKVHSIMMKTKI